MSEAQPIIRFTISDSVRTLELRCRSLEVWTLPGRSGGTTAIHPIVVRLALDRAAGVTRSAAKHVDGRFVVSISGSAGLEDVRQRLLTALERAGGDTRAFAVSVERAGD